MSITSQHERSRHAEPPWLALARADIGTHEASGSADNPVVLAYYRDAGHPGVMHDEIPWCAAFVGAQLERAGVPCSKSLAARSYLTWGKKLDTPRPGCIVVLTRGDPRGWEGHVGFWVGADDSNTIVLGGNQANAVSVAKFPTDRFEVLGYRWPVTASNSRTVRASGLGAAGAAAGGVAAAAKGVADSAPDMLAMGSVLRELAAYLPWVIVVAAVVSLAAYAVIIWARMADAREKGR